MTDQIAKAPADAKMALAQAVDQSTGLDLMTLSTVMVQSGFFPNAESVAQGVVKILAGRELGFPAIASMRHIYVHKGHIGLQATLIATKIRRSGTYDYRIVESTDEKCAIEFKRKVDGEWVVEGTASFTIAEAKRAKLVKSESAWETYPSDLLFARAMTRGQRRYCPDVFGQTVYSEEEVREIEATEPKAAGSSTFEERMAEMMPREKELTLVDGGGIAEVLKGPAPDGVKAAIAAVEALRPAPFDNPARQPDQLGVPPHTQDNYQRMTDAELKGAAQPDLPAGQTETVPVQDRPVFTEREQPENPNTPRGGAAEEDRISEEAPPLKFSPPAKTTFTVGTQRFETNGITRAQMMELFKLYPRVAKKWGQEKAADVLRKEFGLEHRADLTEEQAEMYQIRLREMLEN